MQRQPIYEVCMGSPVYEASMGSPYMAILLNLSILDFMVKDDEDADQSLPQEGTRSHYRWLSHHVVAGIELGTFGRAGSVLNLFNHLFLHLNNFLSSRNKQLFLSFV